MSLGEAPLPDLDLLRGRLERIETEWMLATSTEKRKKLNEEFMAFASEIKAAFGDQGKKVVDDVLARHKELLRAQLIST